MARTANLDVAASSGRVRIRVLVPTAYLPRVLIVYVHDGAAWGTVDDYETVARKIADRTGATVLQIGYRQDVDGPWFTSAARDVSGALQWLGRRSDEYAYPGAPVILLGDGLGADLAIRAAAASGSPRLDRLILVSPLLGSDLSAAEDVEPSGLPTLARPDFLRWAWSRYAGPGQAGISVDLAHLPNTLLLAAEHDPARGQAEALHTRLAAEGVDAACECVVNAVHGFFALLELHASERGFQTIVRTVRHIAAGLPRRNDTPGAMGRHAAVVGAVI